MDLSSKSRAHHIWEYIQRTSFFMTNANFWCLLVLVGAFCLHPDLNNSLNFLIKVFSFVPFHLDPTLKYPSYIETTWKKSKVTGYSIHNWRAYFWPLSDKKSHVSKKRINNFNTNFTVLNIKLRPLNSSRNFPYTRSYLSLKFL